MHASHGRLVRPLLECSRHELRTELARRHATYVEDETNLDVNIPRNRVRQELLPLLVRRFNPRIAEALASEAVLAQEAWEVVGRVVAEVWPLIVVERPDRLELDAAALEAQSPGLQRALVWRAMNVTAGSRPVSFADVTRALRVLRGAYGGIDAPGQRVQRLGSRLVLTRRAAGAASPTPDGSGGFDLPLEIPGESALPGGVLLSAELASSVPEGFRPEPHAEALIQTDRHTGGWRVRSRRPGDRFRPAGASGHKKLQDYFVDRKIARAERDRIPIVVDAQNRIVWVAGHAIDEAFRVTDPSKGVIVLRLRQLGGFG
jgi:tRNA(Ile)-lysidine synthase